MIGGIHVMKVENDLVMSNINMTILLIFVNYKISVAAKPVVAISQCTLTITNTKLLEITY